MNKFQVGKTYATRSIADHECIFSFTILARTAKTVTVKVNGATQGRALVMFHAGCPHYGPWAAEWRNMFYGEGVWLAIGRTIFIENGEWLHRQLDAATARVQAWPEWKRTVIREQISR